ncbi:serine--tRNA ligase [bacterium (Candidatus Gribaldobacteria) CG07_land_8_20_14_0_80_33_18]|uniref:Serine--tRNA ligase n=1 Tax=bacterium (Candidatus Gribaldobacteria) CG07_land_8_20_14_0_80_33_18 TaxID=2014272 RepID=A0A2M6Z477_9BACT|nr:MAG: serine--tRNA ligase [bacterium (Candidatus Gribaldobacteria) CG07_land_8_20_14_0_80_33_18]PJA00747.1 MAG: serine--tRNA ligase [bacterium (Candidatus Gribaldobacteria) CG_4_10_14_0_2_um_filter_33_15]
MLDINFIRKNPNLVKEGCRKKQLDVDIDKLLEVDNERIKLLREIESLKAEQNQITKGSLTPELIQKAKSLKEKIKEIEPNLEAIQKEFAHLMLLIPNLPLEEVPVGKSEKDNIVLEEIGVASPKPKFSFQPKDYLELAENLNLIDVKRAAKVSGSRFGYFKNEAVLLEFALINFTFDTLVKKGFMPVIPPVMIKPEMMQGMGYLIKAPEEGYFLDKDNLILVGTAEHSIGPMHSGEIFKEEELPKRYLGFSTCFRREAGSYGKDTKGILRVHQFDKIEMFSFTEPTESKKEHQFFLENEKELVKALELPFQVVQICSVDMAFPTAAQYDIETWIPSENNYRETHSTSNCTDFQARRLNIRYSDKAGKLNFVHTVNGTAFAIGRILIAILENYQRKDGKINVPKVLQKYLNFKTIPQK